MNFATITEVHTLNDPWFEKVFMYTSPDRIAGTVSACMLQATNTADIDNATRS